MDFSGIGGGEYIYTFVNQYNIERVEILVVLCVGQCKVCAAYRQLFRCLEMYMHASLLESWTDNGAETELLNSGPHISTHSFTSSLREPV